MKLDTIMVCVTFGTAMLGLTRLTDADTCNGFVICNDPSYQEPNPCTPLGLSCSVTLYSPNHCSDCISGQPTDDCAVLSYQTGWSQTVYHGLCDGTECNGGITGEAIPITCATSILVDTECTPAR